MSSAAEEYFISKAKGRGRRRRRRGGEAEFLCSALRGCSAPRNSLGRHRSEIARPLEDVCFASDKVMLAASIPTMLKIRPYSTPFLSAFLLIRTEHYLGFLF